MMNTSELQWALAPAKINLFFNVIHRNEDGYHQIESFITPVSLYDTVFVEPSADGEIHIRVHLPKNESYSSSFREDIIPEDEHNLCFRAAQALREYTGEKKGVKITLIKRIPSKSGLGGGSSDAASVLKLLNRLWGIHLPEETLVCVASHLGCDVPLFLLGGAVICEGRGERITPVEDIPEMWLVLIRPPVGLSTPRVYRECIPQDQAEKSEKKLLSDVFCYSAQTSSEDESCRKAKDFTELDNMIERWDMPALIRAVRAGRLTVAGRYFSNRLTPAAQLLTPWIGRLLKELANPDLGCLGAEMTGSGSCCFGLCRDRAHAQLLKKILREKQLGAVYSVKTLNRS